MLKILQNLWTLYGSHKKYFLWMLVVLFVAETFGASIGFVTGKLVDAYAVDQKSLALWFVITMITVQTVSKVVMPMLHGLIEARYIAYNLIGTTIQHLLQGLFRLSIGQHIAENSGRRQSVMKRGEDALINFTTSLVFNVMPIVTMSIVNIGFLMTKSYTMAAVLFVGLVAYVWMIFRLNTSLKPGILKSAKLMQEDDRLEHEFVKYAPLVLINSQKAKVFDKTTASWENLLAFCIPFWTQYVIKEGMLRIFHPLITGIVLVLGYLGWSSGSMTAGDAIVTFFWTSGAMNRIGVVCDLQRQMAKQLVDIEQLFEMIGEEPDVKEIENPVKPDFKGAIEFDDVVFAYKPRESSKRRSEVDEIPYQPIELPAVLKGVSFRIEPGQRVALVGESGAGKSTIFQALLRAKDPISGAIRIDGHDLKTLDLHHYRMSIGVVEQGVQMFDWSLRENLIFGCNGRVITDEQLMEVCKAAGVDRFFHRLDHGFDTLLGDRGVKLSGGQNQRAAIARALIKEPKFLLLDEATNSLDAGNEKMITEAIEASQGCTTLVIAHRLNTIKNCDKIIVVDKGLISDQGTHDELMSRSEIYQTLVKSQLM